MVNSIFSGFIVGGSVGEYYLQKDWVKSVKTAINDTMDDIYSRKVIFDDGGDKRYVNSFSTEVTGKTGENNSVYVFGNLVNAENSQINFTLGNNLKFLESVKLADNDTGELPVFNVSSKERMVLVSNLRSNLSKVYYNLYWSKLAFTDPSNVADESRGLDWWAEKVVGLTDKASFGFSSMRRDQLFNLLRILKNY